MGQEVCHRCCPPELDTASPFGSLAVASYVDTGLGAVNICYLTQIKAQTQRRDKWNRTGQNTFCFHNGLMEVTIIQLKGQLEFLQHFKDEN